MTCEYCNHPVQSYVALCSNCYRFGRNISQYITFHQLDIPVGRLNDIPWLIRNAGFYNDKHPAYPRLMEMLSTEPEWKNFYFPPNSLVAEILNLDQSHLA